MVPILRQSQGKRGYPNSIGSSLDIVHYQTFGDTLALPLAIAGSQGQVFEGSQGQRVTGSLGHRVTLGQKTGQGSGLAFQQFIDSGNRVQILINPKTS